MRFVVCAAQIIKRADFGGCVFAKTAQAMRNFIFANARRGLNLNSAQYKRGQILSLRLAP